ncbi:RNA polymerase sigma factor [Rhodoligotrophos defluvii]|uniref:RNA polymerase sigma factor n=1 Tax=Rhodoligotrophos defluvii TaxID=2561934 RepID=UPI001EF066E6|nr:RNA polymerase sigma factor [Rhodoligotrophos defluvii]
MSVAFSLEDKEAPGSSIAHDLVCLLPRLRHYALLLCRSPAMADDLVQDACVRALAAAESWTPGTRFDAWVFRILRNHWIDVVRRQKVELVSGQDDAAAEVAAPDAEPQIMSRFELAEVCRAIDLLPPDQQEVLLLVCGQDMTYREAADILGVPVGTVMSRLARARKRLLELTNGGQPTRR